MKHEFELELKGNGANIAPRTRKKERFGGRAPWYYLGLIGEVGFAIALPIAGGAVVGVVIDRTWSTTPKATLSLLFLGVIVSFISLYKTVQTIMNNTS